MTHQKHHTEGGKEKEKSLSVSSETVKLTVKQPEKIRSLLAVLADLERISEVVMEDSSRDLGAGTSAGASSGQAAGSASASQRGRAIQSLPTVPVMRNRLTKSLQREGRQLERRARRLARSTKKGSAYALNELYARIRKIQALIAELVDAAAEVVRRLYIRLFIDHQQLV